MTPSKTNSIDEKLDNILAYYRESLSHPAHPLEDRAWKATDNREKIIFATERAKAAIEAYISERETAARLKERSMERQELLKAYRLTAHNSGFGRQLKDNLTRNANRMAELQRKPRLVGITMPDGQVVRLHSSESELESGKS